jgi:hypothetical protein
VYRQAAFGRLLLAPSRRLDALGPISNADRPLHQHSGARADIEQTFPVSPVRDQFHQLLLLEETLGAPLFVGKILHGFIEGEDIRLIRALPKPAVRAAKDIAGDAVAAIRDQEIRTDERMA